MFVSPALKLPPKCPLPKLLLLTFTPVKTGTVSQYDGIIEVITIILESAIFAINILDCWKRFLIFVVACISGHNYLRHTLRN